MFLYSKDDLIALPIAFAIMAVYVLTVFLIFRKKDEKHRRIPLIIPTVLLLILEIIKQVRNVAVDFDTYSLPFHYCSLFAFFFPLAELAPRRIADFFRPIAFATSFTVSLFFYFSPVGVIGSSSSYLTTAFLPFHSFVYHHLVIVYAAVSILLRCYTPKRDDWKGVLTVMSAYCCIALPLSHILNTNYCNFLTSVIPPMEKLRLAAGQAVFSVVMCIGIAGGTAAISFIYYSVYRKFTHRKI